MQVFEHIETNVLQVWNTWLLEKNHLNTTQGAQADSCPSNLRTVTNTTTGQTACGSITGPQRLKLTFIIGGDYSIVW